MEGSAEKAWKSLGFVDAYASRTRAPMRIIGRDSAKRAANGALAATTRSIERSIASPTPEQARVMGVESAVEGEWNLSTEQLQVLALARSCALRRRRKFRGSRLARTVSPVPVASADTETAVATKRRVIKVKSKGGHTMGPKITASITDESNEEQRRGFSPQQLSAGPRGWDDAPASQRPLRSKVSPEEAEGSIEKTTPTRATYPPFSSASNETRPRHELGETQEQLLAIARGGVRYVGKVFHRKGIKLTEDSPRSMLPRDAFWASGPHLLGKKVLLIARDSRPRIFVAELLAVVKAVPTDAAETISFEPEAPKPERSVAPSPARRRPRNPSGALPVEPSFVCDGVSFEVRQLLCSCRAIHGEGAPDTPEPPPCLEHAVPPPSGVSRVKAAAEEALAAMRGGGGSDNTFEGQRPRRATAGNDTAHVRGLVGQVLPSLPIMSTESANPSHDSRAASVAARCPESGASEAFSKYFTHLEIDALLGPKLPWNDPFKVETNTVGGLEATSWAACLESLCGRLRASTPVDTHVGKEEGAQQTGEGERITTTSCGATSTAIVESTVILSGLVDGAQGEAQHPQQKQGIENGLPASTTADRPGPSTDPLAALEAETTTLGRQPRAAGNTFEPCGCAVGAVYDESRWQAAKVVPVVRSRKAEDEPEEAEANEGLWFDKTILRVGARVPWGRLHRGRFAKVLFNVSLGKHGHGLEFSAISNSPTADPMLRGAWECRATNRDVARYLSSGCVAVAGVSRGGTSHLYDPQRCIFELQERGELEWACAVIARTAFRLVLVVPGGVVLSLAGVTMVGGREVAWPQDIEEDRVGSKATSHIQRAWRGFSARKRTRWLRMEREGRRRLSRMRRELEAERERMRVLEEEAKEKLMRDEERRTRAQVALAAAARGRAARRETSRRRAEQISLLHLEREAAALVEEKPPSAAAAARSGLPSGDKGLDGSNETPGYETGIVIDDDPDVGTKTMPGMVRLDEVVTIDGTEVHLIAHVKDATAENGGGRREQDNATEMLLVAVDKRARRSSRLSLDAAEVAQIIDSHRGRGGGDVVKGVRGVFLAVLQRLTVFNSRRKDLFILSYKGKKVVARH